MGKDLGDIFKEVGPTEVNRKATPTPLLMQKKPPVETLSVLRSKSKGDALIGSIFRSLPQLYEESFGRKKESIIRRGKDVLGRRMTRLPPTSINWTPNKDDTDLLLTAFQLPLKIEIISSKEKSPSDQGMVFLEDKPLSRTVSSGGTQPLNPIKKKSFGTASDSWNVGPLVSPRGSFHQDVLSSTSQQLTGIAKTSSVEQCTSNKSEGSGAIEDTTWSTQRFRISANKTLLSLNILETCKRNNFKRVRLAGWPGIFLDLEEDQAALRRILNDSYDMEPIFLKRPTVEYLIENCYLKIINPLLMNLLDLKITDVSIGEEWAFLRKFSEDYAQQIARLAHQGSQIMLLDHYLLLIPYFLRKMYTIKQLNCSISMYFNNVFPSFSVLKLFPFAQDILDSLTGLDVITFQSFEHLDGFVQATKYRKKAIFGFEKGVMYIIQNNKATVLGVNGICACEALLSEVQDTKGFSSEYEDLKQQYKGRYVIVSVDSFTSNAAVELRLQSLDEFMKEHCKGAPISFVQIMNDSVPWVRYSHTTKDKIEEYRRLFSEFRPSSDVFQPELILSSEISDDRLYAYLKCSNMLLNTRLSSSSDAVMVAFFLLNQNAHAVMSEFSTFDRYVSTMQKVNPYNKQSFSKGMLKVLKASGYFSGKDLARDHRTNPKFLEPMDAKEWLFSILTDIKVVRSLKTDDQDAFETQRLVHFKSTVSQRVDTSRLKTLFKTSKKILILLELNSTLATESKGELIVTNEGKTIRLPPKVNRELLKTLEGVAKDSRVQIYIITSRGLEEVKQMIGDVSLLGIGAEKGYYFKLAGEKSKQGWEKICEFNESWKNVALNIMKQYERKIPGSLTEFSNTGIVWSYGTNSDEITIKQAQTLKKSLQKTLSNYSNIEVISGQGLIEVKHHVISRAAFVELLIRYLQQRGERLDFIVAVGSAEGSEGLFMNLNKMQGNTRLISSVSVPSDQGM